MMTENDDGNKHARLRELKENDTSGSPRSVYELITRLVDDTSKDEYRHERLLHPIGFVAQHARDNEEWRAIDELVRKNPKTKQLQQPVRRSNDDAT